MARTYNDAGIVLRRTDLHDHDRLLTILTREHGKISAMARGVRKPTAKLAAHVDLFAVAEMSFVAGRGPEILIGAVRRPDSYFDDGIEALAYASLLAEAADRFIEPSTPVSDLFDLLQQALQDLTHAPLRRVRALWHLYLLLDWMGHAPLLERCVQCGTPLPAAALAFMAHEGGFLCPDHRGLQPLLPLSVRPLLGLLAARDRAFFEFPFSSSDLFALESVILDLMEEHLASPLKSRAFLRAIAGAPR